MPSSWDAIWFNANVATMVAGDEAGYGLIEDGAVAVKGERIAWIGPTDALPAQSLDACPNPFDCGGRLVTPGLIDCHTHVVYGGNRANEFEMRLNGASYEEIARRGGGIAATVEATRAAGEDALYAQSAARLSKLTADGVTTVEIKSGYGLDTETELKMLRVARRLGESLPVTVRTTFLGAHAVPPEYAGRADDYIDLVCDEMMPRVASERLADAVDVFCERIAFDPEQAERVFRAARALHLPVKCHAEQLSDLKGAVLAARYGALSVDHLEYLDEQDVPEIARAGSAAVLLPGAFYVLRETRLPPIPALRRHRVPIALATDCNPGSSPVLSLTLMLNMACTLFRLTPAEALAGVTRNAGRALGMTLGTLVVGTRADLVLWDAERPGELSYAVGDRPCRRVMYGGRDR